MKHHLPIASRILWTVCFLTMTSNVHAEETPSKIEQVDVESVKQRYWTKGEESELRVVRSRTYTKGGKVEIGGFWGSTSGDPFLSIRNLGGTIGYHLNEYVGVELLGWSNMVSSSSALTTLERDRNTTANVNKPKSFLGGEVIVSPIYGKLSLLGKAIIYFDIHGLVGIGSTDTQSGRYITPMIGIGEQVYLSRYISLRIDYRLTYYKEDIPNALNPSQIVNTNSNFSNVITLGFSVLL